MLNLPSSESPELGSPVAESMPIFLKIGYVVKRYPRFSETFIVNEILALEEAGVEIAIYSLRPPSDTHFQDSISRIRASVTYLDTRPKAEDLWRQMSEASERLSDFWITMDVTQGEHVRDIFQAVQLAKMILDDGITHLHAHFGTSSATVARMASRLAGISFSFTAHAKDIFHESIDPSDLRRKIEQASTVVTVSRYNEDYLESVMGADRGRIRVVYNGMHLDRFTFDQKPSIKPVVLAVGRMVTKKGFDTLIDACALLRDRGLSFACRIIGTGELEEELAAKIQHLKLSAVVELVGPRPQSEVIQEVRDALVFAAPCTVGEDGNRDGLPTVLVEAMALGTACVSTPVTGIPEAIEDGVTGLLVQERNPDELATAIQQLLCDSSLRERLTRNARHLIEQRFDIQKNVQELLEIFLSAHNSESTSTLRPSSLPQTSDSSTAQFSGVAQCA